MVQSPDTLSLRPHQLSNTHIPFITLSYFLFISMLKNLLLFGDTFYYLNRRLCVVLSCIAKLRREKNIRFSTFCESSVDGNAIKISVYIQFCQEQIGHFLTKRRLNYDVRSPKFHLIVVIFSNCQSYFFYQ